MSKKVSAKGAIERIVIKREIDKEVSDKYNKALIELRRELPLRVSSEEEFYSLITSIVQFFESKTGLSASNNVLALQTAEEIFAGSRAGTKGAKDAALKGIGGGVLALADAICQNLRDISERNRFMKILREECDEFSDFEKIRFVADFKRYLGNYLPKTARETRPEELVPRYKEIIWEYYQDAKEFTKTFGL